MILIFTFSCLLLICLFVLDDLYIDAIAFVKQLGPKELKPEDLERINKLSEKKMAILIANWNEHEVLERMISGNSNRLIYKNYHFFLGVYPNDLETSLAAKKSSNLFSNVHCVVNSKLGPTSKGQMLNELVRGVFDYEKKNEIQFDVFLMHDSEDILHPLSLKMINSEITKTDFLQIPIFSFDRPMKEWVGSTYIDEFAEIHTKDLFVRKYLGAPVPSAGVGTALQRNLVMTLLEENEGDLLREESLTEDYVLGMSSAIQGFRTSFCCYYFKNKNNQKEFIATREYFPNQLQSAVRQKTRWILGIVFQGSKLIPWQGSLVHKYFLYRDRRGPANNFVVMMTTVLTIYLLVYSFVNGHLPEFMSENWFKLGSLIATVGMFSRMYHRLKAVISVNGWGQFLGVFLRWPLGHFVNFLASMRALKAYRLWTLKKEPLKWVKTKHELPVGFGNEKDHFAE